MRLIKQRFPISGMQCDECALHVEEAVQDLPGVFKAEGNFGSESVALEYDADIISLNTLRAAIQKAGYDLGEAAAEKKGGIFKRIAAISAGLLGIVLLLYLDRWVQIDLPSPTLQTQADYGILFLIGVLTSFHCIGMCGGFVLGYTAAGSGRGWAALPRHLAYGLGKTLSYTSFGALFGLLGAFLAFTPLLRGIVMAAAGIFLLLYGLSMLQAFAVLRRVHIRMPKVLHNFVITRQRHFRSPLIVGLLNGLMIACGPLQAMYILAAGTGSAWQGGAMLFFFALGTLPVMLAFGFFASLITTATSKKMLQISGMLIVLLGIVMLNRSLVMLDSGYDFHSLSTKFTQMLQNTGLMKDRDAASGLLIQNGYQVVYMEVHDDKLQPSEFIIKRNYPVKWIIDVKKLSPCNKQLVIPSLNKTIELHPGLQMVEFLPEQAGAINWSCSMGMMSGSFKVVD